MMSLSGGDPDDLAASMNSFSFIDSTCPRTRRASPRECVPDVGEPHQQIVDAATKIAGGKPNRQPDGQDDALYQDPDRERDPASEQQPAEGVSAQLVRAKKEPRLTRGGLDILHVLLHWVLEDPELDQQRAEKGDQHQNENKRRSSDCKAVAPEALPGISP